MNTTLLKRFATEARKILLQGVGHRLEGMGFDLQTGKAAEMPQLLGGGAVFMGNVVSTGFYDRWMSLYHNIERRGLRDVAEEAAYTWFNRLVAIRILSKQGFISPVLQYESEDVHVPLIVSEARHGRMPEMSQHVRKELEGLLNDDSKTNEQFALLIVAFCHSNPIINRCFGNITDYTELLLPQDILREDGFVDMLNNTPFISDGDYGSSELIGWLYQFYISDRKDEVFAKKGKYDADEIAPATQIFTPEWIVQYMVQNTLGRIYLDNNPYAADEFKPKWKYLVDQEQRDDEHICHFDNLEDIRCADLGCGSGHIVGYMFEVLFDLYLYEGYSRREAVEHILKENLTGVDIDQRAKQLATFALLLKACQKDKSFADAKVMPNILDMPEPFVSHADLADFADNKEKSAPSAESACEDKYIREQFSHFILGSDTAVLNEIVDAVRLMDDAKTLGSIMKFNISERTRNILKVRLEDYEQQDFVGDDIKRMMPYVKVILALTENYTALVMNPPYMKGARFDSVLGDYVTTFYHEGKADLATVFVQMMPLHLMEQGKYAFIIPPSWMFLSTFENLRISIIENKVIDSFLHLSRGIFGADFGSSCAVITNTLPKKETSGTYFRLIERTFQEFEQKHLKILFEKTLENHDFRYKFSEYSKSLETLEYSEDGAKIYYPNIKQNEFKKITGSPFAFWLKENIIEAYSQSPTKKYIDLKTGITTGDNPRFTRFWNEVNKRTIGDYWILLRSGATFRKWYGCLLDIVYWKDDGALIKSMPNSTMRNEEYWYRPAITWSKISSGDVAVRYSPQKILFDAVGLSGFAPQNILFYAMALFDSKVGNYFIRITNQSMSILTSDLGKIPFIQKNQNQIVDIVSQNVSISKYDWDSHENSWDFSENPLVSIMKAAEEGKDTVSEIVPQPDTNSVTARHEQCQSVTQAMSRRDTSNVTARHNECQSEIQAMSQFDSGEAKEWNDKYHDAELSLQSFLHPANGITNHGSTLEKCVNVFEKLWTVRFMQLHANEEELNRQFIDIYGLQDELTPDVPLDEITILQQGEITIKDSKIVWNEDTLIKQLISYAVGVCMGRYRLDKAGLHIAYPNPSDDDLKTYMYNGREVNIDDDGIIPLMPSSSPFNDNMLKRLNDFIQVVFGDEYLNDNLNYMEKALGMTLEQYLQKDFWKDHKRMYQNRPIYWLFSSKKGAFQCIAYMHRMDAWTAERVRTKYLLPYIEYLVNKQNDMQANAANLTAVERRELDKITKQIAECREYHDRLHEVADKEIAFDLDDGVVVNYAKFGNVLAKIK